MKRRLIIIAALLIAGFVIQWGVAWGLALVPLKRGITAYLEFPGDSRRKPGRNTEEVFSATSVRQFGALRRVWVSFELDALNPGFRPGLYWNFDLLDREPMIPLVWQVGGPTRWGRLPEDLSEFRSGRLGQSGVEDARGFPALSAWCGFVATNGKSWEFATLDLADGGVMLGAIDTTLHTSPFVFSPVRPNAGSVRALPLRPIWPGIAINTTFYALLLWILLSARRVVMERRRMLRGRCPKCRYDLGFVFAGGCSECGWRR